jgi:hypothetical protein
MMESEAIIAIASPNEKDLPIEIYHISPQRGRRMIERRSLLIFSFANVLLRLNLWIISKFNFVLYE